MSDALWWCIVLSISPKELTVTQKGHICCWCCQSLGLLVKARPGRCQQRLHCVRLRPRGPPTSCFSWRIRAFLSSPLLSHISLNLTFVVLFSCHIYGGAHIVNLIVRYSQVFNKYMDNVLLLQSEIHSLRHQNHQHWCSVWPNLFNLFNIQMGAGLWKGSHQG